MGVYHTGHVLYSTVHGHDEQGARSEVQRTRRLAQGTSKALPDSHLWVKYPVETRDNSLLRTVGSLLGYRELRGTPPPRLVLIGT